MRTVKTLNISNGKLLIKLNLSLYVYKALKHLDEY